MKNALLLFDPMNHQMLVGEAALRRGLDVVAIKTMPVVTTGPYARSIDRVSYMVDVDSWMDDEGIEKAVDHLLTKYNIVATYTAMEIILPVEARIRARLGLPHIPEQRLLQLLDKEYVRRELQSHGLSQLRCYSEKEAAEMDIWPEGLNCYFKPAYGSSSAYVVKCHNIDEYRQAHAQWEKRKEADFSLLIDFIERGNKYFLEEGAEGELLSVEALNSNGEFKPIGLTSRTLLKSNPVMELGAQFPYQHKFKDNIIEAVRKIHEALDINYGATHTEVIVDAEGRVELVEMNLRFAGADVLLTINQALGLKMEDQLLDMSLGYPLIANYDASDKAYSTVQYVMAPPGLDSIESIEFPDYELDFQRIFQPVGQKVNYKKNQGGFLAGFIVSDKNFDTLVDKATEIRKKIKVNGLELGDNANNIVLVHGSPA